MNKLFIPLSLIFISVFTATAQITKEVLFIGNSYTKRNNLPLIVSKVVESTGDILVYDSNLIPGHRLSEHDSDATTLLKINSEDWDYVVLQAQSQETSWEEFQKQAELYPFAKSLSDAIRVGPCSQPMFYMTWGRKNMDDKNCPQIQSSCTYEGMDDVIKATYEFMANENDAELAPVGAVWRYIRENHPNINLYHEDESHPSYAGSYVAACTFYTMIYKKNPNLITFWDSRISEIDDANAIADANTIKAAVKTIVFDQISNWDYTINPAVANYDASWSSNELVFSNTSNNYDTLLWDFGDGNTSTETNPVHTFTSTGNFDVSLTVTKCGKSKTLTKNFVISNLNTENIDSTPVSVFINLESNQLIVDLNKTYKALHALIFDISGKTLIDVRIQDSKGMSINTEHLQEGIYILKIFSGHQIINTSKFIKQD